MIKYVIKHNNVIALSIMIGWFPAGLSSATQQAHKTQI